MKGKKVNKLVDKVKNEIEEIPEFLKRHEHKVAKPEAAPQE